MSRFNYSTELCDQVEQLDDKLAEVIILLKKIEKRVSTLEKIAREKGILNNSNKNKSKQTEESCIVM
tara:strand:- start:485 stop:685 length:201 start_codon:yes stop_codon:yes gene_type:complete